MYELASMRQMWGILWPTQLFSYSTTLSWLLEVPSTL